MRVMGVSAGRRVMISAKTQLWGIVFILLVSLCLLPNTAVAKTQCRDITRGSTIEGLGEEFPELYIGLVVCIIGNQLPGFILGYAEALGEEFQDRQAPPEDDSLGEEFPERSQSKSDTREALGEEYPE